MQAMLESSEHGFEFQVQMIVVCVQRGLRLDWVPIRTIYGDEKSQIRKGHHVKPFFRVVWQTRRTTRGARHREHV